MRVCICWIYKGAPPICEIDISQGHLSHNLNSLKGHYIGDHIGDYYRAYSGGYSEFRLGFI